MPARPKKNHRAKKSHVNGRKSATKVKEQGSFRIISGDHRSRRIEFPVVEGLRPTTDRVKESVFNWLQPHIEGANVLDLFAGSGALAFEAISRHAAYVCMCEKNIMAAQAIKKNLEHLKVDEASAQVMCVDTLVALKTSSIDLEKGLFDIVLIDPPFRKAMLGEVIGLLVESNVLKSRALVYIEQEKEGLSPDFPANWCLLKEKQAGQVLYRLYQVQ